MQDRVIENLYKSILKRKQPENKIPLRIEIDQYFSFIREKHAVGDSYLNQPLREGADLDNYIMRHLNGWFVTQWDYLDNIIPDNFLRINKTFASSDSLAHSNMENLFEAIDKCHAFHDTYRFYKGGLATMKQEFVRDNELHHLKKVFNYLIFGDGDFIDRMGICIYDSSYSISHFGRSCIQELFGWVNKNNIPICNGRTVKALRYLGFNVKIFN